MPRRKQGSERALGPYRHGAKWRVVYVGANGVREVESYSTEEEAIRERDAANLTSGNRSLGEAVDAYLNEREAKGDHVDTIRYRLRSIFRLKEGDRPLHALTKAVAESLYAKRTTETRHGKPIAVDTHHGELVYAKAFCDWCVKRGWLALNPFAEIEPIGHKRKGKPKLRVNATRQFLAYLVKDESIEATAVMTALMLGLRASEVVKRTVEDLDDDGYLIWVRETKTDAGDREIEVPAVLRDRLVKLAQGKAPTDLLFGNVSRHWLHYHSVRLCKEAGVPRVTPHGLRGSGATTAVRLGGSVADVARALGHADDGATALGHYIAPGAVESARARGIEALALGTKRDRIVPKGPSEAN